MFVMEDQWAPRDDRVEKRTRFTKVTEKCRESTFPKNIVVYTGDLHTQFVKEFIDEYFQEDSLRSLEINVPSRYGRCLKLNIDTLPFL